MQEVAKTQQLHSLNVMLERIRDSHIDIVPIIKEELDNLLQQYIEEIVKNIYENLGEEK